MHTDGALQEQQGVGDDAASEPLEGVSAWRLGALSMIALDSATYLQHARVGIYDESCVCHAAINQHIAA